MEILFTVAFFYLNRIKENIFSLICIDVIYLLHLHATALNSKNCFVTKVLLREKGRWRSEMSIY